MKIIILFLILFISCGSENAQTPTSAQQIPVQSKNFLITTERINFIEECGTGGIFVYSGSDTNNDKKLTDDEIYAISYICDGTNGMSGNNGRDGLNALVNFERQSNLPFCSGADGLILVSGLDTNRNLLLEGEEIQHSSFVCDGKSITESIFEILYPCGKIAGQYNEVVLKSKEGIIAYFENGIRRHLAILDENVWYETTDSKKCKFRISNRNIVYE